MLRDYQERAIAAAAESLARNQSCLLVAATGVGKTTIFCEIIRRALAKNKRVCVMAHRDELIQQAHGRIESMTGVTPQIEKASLWAEDDADVFVTSVQSMNAKWFGGKRYERFKPENYDILIIDEAHHACSSTYLNVIQHFAQNPASKLIGVTATPDRGDEIGLGNVFDESPFIYEIGDAVSDGWLVPVRQKYVTVGSLDYSQIRTRMGDLCGGDLAEVLEEEQNLHGMVHPTIELLQGKSAIVFCATVRQAELAADIFNRHEPGSAACVHGKMDRDQRKATLAQFAKGEIRFVTNVGVLTEGFDAPRCDAVVMMTATKVRAKYVQCVGRATRPLAPPSPTMTAAERTAVIASSDKPYCTVIDFKGNSGRHKLIGMTDVLAGDAMPEIVQRAKDIIDTSPDPMDPEEALRMAEIQEEEAKQREAAKAREKLQRARVRLRAQFSTREVDPFSRFDMTPTHPSNPKEMASEKQQAMLMNNGVDPVGLTRKQAGRLVADIMMRRKLGRPSLKQEALLTRYGLHAATAKQAKSLIDEIAEAGWKDPRASARREPETGVLSGESAEGEGPLPEVDGG
jgi:superfamily II DNA or RNA helicase